MINLHITPAEELIEQFETLKHRVFASMNANSQEGIVLAFTSCTSGEGVTSTATNFAATVAEEEEKNVLLMDCNLRRPSLHNLFLKGNEGIKTDSDEQEKFGSIWQVVRANDCLDVLITSKNITNPGSIFKKTWFADLLSQARERYDCIVLDCPPLGRDGACLSLVQKATATVLVVEAERVRREVIQRLVSTFEDSGINLLGTVLNKRRYPIPGYLYKLL
jgi:Mrp family chromosome partitioning ATPase